MPIMSPDSLEQKGKNTTESNANMLQSPLNQQPCSSLDGPVAILWDIENCRVPSDVSSEDVAGNIRMALQVHPIIQGAVVMFSAYGDFNAFPRRLREGCQRTGVKLIDVPNGRKDAADKAILVDMFLFALDNPPLSSIMLISGDVDFAPALHILGQRGYAVILVIPTGAGVSSALCNAGKFVWDWPSVAHGKGFIPPSKALMPSRVGPVELARGYHINENCGGLNEEEAIVYRGMSQSCYNSRNFSMVSQSTSEYNSDTTNMASLPTTESGLRAELQQNVSIHEIRDYSTLVNKCRAQEDCNRKVVIQRSEAFKRKKSQDSAQGPPQKKPRRFKGKQVQIQSHNQQKQGPNKQKQGTSPQKQVNKPTKATNTH